jgi:acyl-activating enzyme 14
MDKPTILKYFFRLKETWKGRQYVKKLLNGGGSLSAELMKDATELFPRAKLLSAYGSDLSIFVVFFFNIIFWHVIFFLGSIFDETL